MWFPFLNANGALLKNKQALSPFSKKEHACVYAWVDARVYVYDLYVCCPQESFSCKLFWRLISFLD